MADPIFLSLWFASFEDDEVLPHTLSVLRQFRFSPQRPGIVYMGLHPVSWQEATIWERRFDPGARPEEAILFASEFLHADYAYVFEGYWDLWERGEDGIWIERPARVRFISHGLEFEDGIYQQEGHMLLDLGLDSAFLQEEAPLTPEAEDRVRSNVHKLVELSNHLEKAAQVKARLLWSESEENLAQKLLARLQKLQ